RAKNHAVDGYRSLLAPVRHLRTVLFACGFDERSVCDYVVAVGRCDEEFDRRFVVRMVYRGEPVVRAVGPVVGKYGAVSKFVLLEEQPVAGFAVILHGNRAAVAARVVALKLNIEMAFGLRESGGPVV